MPLFPTRTTRVLAVSPPLAAPPDVVLDAIRAELRRQGSRIRVAGPDRIEFDGPGLFDGGGVFAGTRTRAARLVRSGRVSVDPADPQRIHLELRFSWAAWGWPILIACMLVLMDFPAGERFTALLAVAAFAAFSVFSARNAYESWIAEAARRAGAP